MKGAKFLSTIVVFGLWQWHACRPAPDEIPLPTEVCIETRHHSIPVRGVTVYIKYFAEEFPGYDKAPTYFDAKFTTQGNSGRGCIRSVPEGRHWLVAHGFDSVYHMDRMFGSLPIEISLDARPRVDTIIYLGH